MLMKNYINNSYSKTIYHIWIKFHVHLWGDSNYLILKFLSLKLWSRSLSTDNNDDNNNNNSEHDCIGSFWLSSNEPKGMLLERNGGSSSILLLLREKVRHLILWPHLQQPSNYTYQRKKRQQKTNDIASNFRVTALIYIVCQFYAYLTIVFHVFFKDLLDKKTQINFLSTTSY